jgi:hypothetical protein
MTLISTVTVGSGGASAISFSSIPSIYTDLLFKVSGRSSNSSNAVDCRLTFNGVGTGYSERLLYGNGSSAASANRSDSAWILVPAALFTANTFGSTDIYIPNYSGNTNKSVSSDSVTENNGTSADIYLDAILWSNTAAITSLVLTCTVGNFVQNSIGSLYGITKGSGGATVP